jgi:hypothetical protein
MSSLELLSALNWIMVVFYVGIGLFFGMVGSNTPPLFLAIAFSVVALFAAPHVYLGLVIEKGRGRVLQTVLGVLSLFNFPIGTAFGAFALFVCWGSRHVELFEAVERGNAGPPRRPRPAALEEESEAEEALADDDQTPLEVHAVSRRRGDDPDVTPKNTPAVRRYPPRNR